VAAALALAEADAEAEDEGLWEGRAELLPEEEGLEDAVLLLEEELEGLPLLEAEALALLLLDAAEDGDAEAVGVPVAGGGRRMLMMLPLHTVPLHARAVSWLYRVVLRVYAVQFMVGMGLSHAAVRSST
jgi:hypothetical protein